MPVRPCGPVSPTRPVEPCTPVTPTGPVYPNRPGLAPWSASVADRPGLRRPTRIARMLDPADRCRRQGRWTACCTTTPVSPRCPVYPTGPVTPGAPTAPVSPRMPVRPCGPVSPITPVEPLHPGQSHRAAPVVTLRPGVTWYALHTRLATNTGAALRPSVADHAGGTCRRAGCLARPV